MAAGRHGGIDRSGDGHHVAVHPPGPLDRGERAAAQRGLHHQRARRQTGDEAVAHDEPLPRRVGAGRQLGHDQPSAGDLRQDAVVAPRVGDVHPAGQDRHRRRAGRGVDRTAPGRARHALRLRGGPQQGAAVGCDVNAVRPAADHAPAALGQAGGPVRGDLRAVAGRSAGADHGHRALHGLVEPVRTPDPQRERRRLEQRLGRPAQAVGGPLVIARGHQPSPARRSPAQVVGRVVARGTGGRRGGQVTTQADPRRAGAQRGPDGHGAVLVDRSVQGRVAGLHHVREAGQRRPDLDGHRHRATREWAMPSRKPSAWETCSGPGPAQPCRSASVQASRRTRP